MNEIKNANISTRNVGRQGGRPPGTPNKVTVATRERIENEADPIGFLGAVMRGEPIKTAPLKDGSNQVDAFPTIDQRVSAARILADKLLPNAKSRPVAMDLPKVETPGDLVSALSAVIATMAEGQITPDEAAVIAGVIEQKRRVIETAELAARIEALEARDGKR
jgi:hypothetical protein